MASGDLDFLEYCLVFCNLLHPLLIGELPSGWRILPYVYQHYELPYANLLQLYVRTDRHWNGKSQRRDHQVHDADEGY
jgi:hypothetical protein